MFRVGAAPASPRRCRSQAHALGGRGRRPRPPPPGPAAGHGPLLRRRLFALAVGEHVGGQGDRPAERALQPRQRLGDLGIAGLGHALGGDLGAGQHVAQVVIDLGHRLAQRRQPGAGVEGGAQVGLHAVELASARPISSRRPEGWHVRRGSSGSARKRSIERVIRCIGPHEKEVERQIDQAPAISEVKTAMPSRRHELGDELLLQRPVGRDDLDEFAGAEPRPGHHPHHPVAAARPGSRTARARTAGLSPPQVDQIGRALRRGAASSSRRSLSTCRATDTTPAPARSCSETCWVTTPPGRGLLDQRRQFGGAHPVKQPALLERGQVGRQDQQVGEDHDQPRSEAAGARTGRPASGSRCTPTARARSRGRDPPSAARYVNRAARAMNGLAVRTRHATDAAESIVNPNSGPKTPGRSNR